MADNASDGSKSDLILEELRRRKEKARTIDVEEKKVKVVLFSLHDGLYALYGEHIKEILPLMTIYYVPGSPDFIPGVINNRGEIESVVSINKFLGLPDSKNGQNRRIALAEKDEIRSGILVDSIEEVLDIPVNSITPPLDTLSQSLKEFVAGEFIHRDAHVTILDVGKIFARLTL